MSLQAVAKVYTTCVDLEERARHQSPELAEEAAILRADVHALLMEALRQAKTPFADRSVPNRGLSLPLGLMEWDDAARIAFDITQGKRKIA